MLPLAHTSALHLRLLTLHDIKSGSLQTPSPPPMQCSNSKLILCFIMHFSTSKTQ